MTRLGLPLAALLTAGLLVAPTSAHSEPRTGIIPTPSPSTSPTASPTATPTAGPTGSPTGTPTGSPTGSPTASPSPPSNVPPPPDDYTPPYGVRFNDPHARRGMRRNIINHLIRTIDSVPAYQKIRIFSWNLHSDDITDALVRAHKRGVSVRIIVDGLNAAPVTPNPNVRRLQHILPEFQAKRRPEMKSKIVLCKSSCRGHSGIAHTKFYLFSQAGTKRDIIMYGSANATDLAANGQWNDLFTLNGKPAFYAKFMEIFNEALLDTPVVKPYQQITGGPYTAYFYPDKGMGGKTDPVLDTLGRVQCGDVADGYGINGHTSLRIAQTGINGERGIEIAKALRKLYEQGCDIKIVYAVFGKQAIYVLEHTKRGPIPIHQIVDDPNHDHIYEKYLHLKDLAISGNYDGNPAVDVTFNGTANWTGLALISDEVVMRIYGDGIEQQYADWVDYLYDHQPADHDRSTTATGSGMTAQQARAILRD